MGGNFQTSLSKFMKETGTNIRFQEQKKGNQVHGKWEVSASRVDGSFNKFRLTTDLEGSWDLTMSTFEEQIRRDGMITDTLPSLVETTAKT